MTTLVAPERPSTAAPARRSKGSGMNRKPRFAIAVTAAFFVVLYLPIFAVVLFSFNTKKSLTVIEGWSLRWYQALFNDAELTKSLQTSLVVAAGFSSMIQWPESGMTPSVTSLAAARITAAIPAPNDFSPPIASTGMASLPPAAR